MPSIRSSTFHLAGTFADNDDRMLVFDPDHFIEVATEQRTAKAGPNVLRQELLEARRAVQADLKSQMIGNSLMFILQNFKDGDEVKTRSFLTRDIRQGAMIIFAQITAGQPDMVRALNRPGH